MLTHHAALIWTMVLVSGADRDMSDTELHSIGEMVKHLPIFGGYELDLLTIDARACGRKVREADGLDKVLEEIRSSLPGKLRETAYALACDVAISDNRIPPEEERALELLRQRLDISQLVAVAIQRGAKARYARV